MMFIVDLVVRYDLEQKRKDERRIATLLQEEEDVDAQLSKVLENDGY